MTSLERLSRWRRRSSCLPFLPSLNPHLTTKSILCNKSMWPKYLGNKKGNLWKLSNQNFPTHFQNQNFNLSLIEIGARVKSKKKMNTVESICKLRPCWPNFWWDQTFQDIREQFQEHLTLLLSQNRLYKGKSIVSSPMNLPSDSLLNHRPMRIWVNTLNLRLNTEQMEKNSQPMRSFYVKMWTVRMSSLIRSCAQLLRTIYQTLELMRLFSRLLSYLMNRLLRKKLLLNLSRLKRNLRKVMCLFLCHYPKTQSMPLT